ncbi:MAG: carboxymuconolactone decarboxylase family protein [Solirubrobacteraceae bacterium]
MSDTITRHTTAIRFLLLALGLPQLLIGLWALIGPHSFYEDFPNGRGWVAALGPFDEHLVTDVGSLFIGLGVLLALAAFWMGRRVVLAATITWLVFAIPHAIFHFLNPDDRTGDAIANGVSVAWTVLGGLIILALLRAPAARAVPARGGDENARIPLVPLDTRHPLTRYAFREARKLVGEVPDPLRVHAHHVPLMLGYGMLEQATGKADRVPERLKALAGVKAASLAGCEFCMDIGSTLARTHGVSEDELRDLLTHRDSPRFSDLDKLVLDYAAGMTRTPVDVPDELFARLRDHFDEGQLVELTNEIALENYRARFSWAFGIGSQDFAAGAFCVPPEPAVATA